MAEVGVGSPLAVCLGNLPEHHRPVWSYLFGDSWVEATVTTSHILEQLYQTRRAAGHSLGELGFAKFSPGAVPGLSPATPMHVDVLSMMARPLSDALPAGSDAAGGARGHLTVGTEGVRLRRSVPDAARTHCAGCRVAFSLTNRRHHCRGCGDIFCGACTALRIHLPGTHVAKDAKERACAKCEKQMEIVTCPAKGCAIQVARCAYDLHMDTVCPAVMKCPNQCGGPPFSVMRAAAHKDVCPNGLISCDQCGALVGRADMHAHVASAHAAKATFEEFVARAAKASAAAAAAAAPGVSGDAATGAAPAASATTSSEHDACAESDVTAAAAAGVVSPQAEHEEGNEVASETVPAAKEEQNGESAAEEHKLETTVDPENVGNGSPNDDAAGLTEAAR